MEQLRRFFSVAHEQNDLAGTEGFESLFADDTKAFARSAFNRLIAEFNHAIDPKAPKPEDVGGSDSDDDEGGDAMSDVDAAGSPSPPNDKPKDAGEVVGASG